MSDLINLTLIELGGIGSIFVALFYFLSKIQINRIRDREQENFKKELHHQTQNFKEKIQVNEKNHVTIVELIRFLINKEYSISLLSR